MSPLVPSAHAVAIERRDRGKAHGFGHTKVPEARVT